MFRALSTLTVITAISTQPALADDTAQYGIGIGFSPFGGSINGQYHASKKTSFNVALGGSPEMDSFMKADIGGTEFSQTGSSTWVGAFINHRPFDNANWFRFVGGIGIGSISSELYDGNGNVYSVEYNENPVGYVGIGFGNSAKKGFQVGFDLGWLQTSGPEIQKIDGSDDEDLSDSIDGQIGFGSVLPNLQLSLGYNF